MASRKGDPAKVYFDSEKKRDWISKNTRNIVVKLNNNTNADIIEFLDGLTVSYASVVKQALREYMERHREEQT